MWRVQWKVYNFFRWHVTFNSNLINKIKNKICKWRSLSMGSRKMRFEETFISIVFKAQRFWFQQNFFLSKRMKLINLNSAKSVLCNTISLFLFLWIAILMDFIFIVFNLSSSKLFEVLFECRHTSRYLVNMTVQNLNKKRPQIAFHEKTLKSQIRKRADHPIWQENK